MNKGTRWVFAALLLDCSFVATLAAQSEDPPILLKGNCPITAFEKQVLVAGQEDIRARVPYVQWNDFNFRFASAEHRDRYESSPEKYIPAICGYCPVALQQLEGQTRFQLGDPKFTQTVDGKTYWFSSSEYLETFAKAIKNSDYQFIPVLGGDCVTCWIKTGARVPGNPFFDKVVDDRLYLFPNSVTRDDFLVNQSSYENKDLALDGECPVERNSIDGDPDIATLHRGMIYRFASKENRNRFLENPEEFRIR